MTMSEDARMTSDALLQVARAIRDLGNADAATSMGGLEALGAVIKESMESHAMVFNDVAHAIESVATSLDRIATALDKPTKPTKPNKPKT